MTFSTGMRGIATCGAVIALAISPSLAQTVEETATRFGTEQSVLDISLSPSGNRIAFISPGPGGSEILNFIDLAGDATVKPISRNSDAKADLVECEFATEDRLVCTMAIVVDEAGVLIGFSRIISVGVDGKDVVMLTPRDSMSALGFRQNGGSVIALDMPGAENRVLMSAQAVPEMSTGNRTAKTQVGLGVDYVDVTNGRRGRVETPDREATRYIADETGRIRIKRRTLTQNGILTGSTNYYFRDATRNEWRKLSEVKSDSQSGSSGFVPIAVDSGTNRAYGFDKVGGYDAIMAMPLVEGAKPLPVLSRSDVDVDELIRIGRQRRVVGGSFATERREIAYFDPKLKMLAQGLAEALPGQPLINIVGASANESKLLIVASSDTDPGQVYLYDNGSRKLEPILPLRDRLADLKMGAMKPVSYPAADGTVIPGYLTLPPGSDGKNLPTIVMPHGGPSARDEWGFDWLVQFFAARGYAVLQPNYRGSSGYGTAWYGRNGFQAWETAIGDVNAAGRWLVAEGVANPKSLAIVGWSYGGYAALQSQVLDPSLFKSVVAIAPVTDLDRLRQDARNYTNYRLVDQFIGTGAHVAAGSPAQHPERFISPVMLVHGTYDQNVNVGHSRLMEKKLKGAGRTVEYLELDGLDHSLSDSAARIMMLQQVDGFLAKTLKR